MLTEDDRERLVGIARRSVVARVAGGPPVVERLTASVPASGVFVTVKIAGALRGCLGTLDAPEDLAAEVARCAANAASEDTRFAPITAAELPVLTLEVSVLRPLEEIDPHDIHAIAIGQHGLVVRRGRHRGLLLPQVAAERRWSRDEFLRQTCVKAGLAADAWRQGTAVYRFTADVFGDRL